MPIHRYRGVNEFKAKILHFFVCYSVASRAVEWIGYTRVSQASDLPATCGGQSQSHQKYVHTLSMLAIFKRARKFSNIIIVPIHLI